MFFLILFIWFFFLGGDGMLFEYSKTTFIISDYVIRFSWCHSPSYKVFMEGQYVNALWEWEITSSKNGKWELTRNEILRFSGKYGKNSNIFDQNIPKHISTSF